MEERRRLGTKQRRHEEQLEKKHAEQADALEKEGAKVSCLAILFGLYL
jgi:hypothetical protein